MNEIIRSLFERKSIRQFTEKDIDEKTREIILLSAAQAPTAGNQQLYTVLDIRSQELKDKLALSCDNQPFIKKAPMVHLYPYWDFNDPKVPDTYRDASAGAVMASAFIELSTLVSDKSKASAYRKQAEKILRTLASEEYLCAEDECHGFLLKHSVGHLPKNSEVDVPLTYADYYFLEALVRYSRL